MRRDLTPHSVRKGVYMGKITFTITKGDYITLQDILKFENLVSSGGEAKAVITDGMVKVNGAVETRRGKKLHSGDKVVFLDNEIEVTL